MNCLFVCRHEPAENFGGIETVTGLLCNEFQSSEKINPYCLYLETVDSKLSRYNFENAISFSEAGDLTMLFKHWNIDVIIIQALTEKYKQVKKAVERVGKNISVIYALHCNPGWEFSYTTWRLLRQNLKMKDPKGWIKILGYPLYKWYLKKRLIKTYQEIYKSCDCFVVLSNNFIEESAKIFRFKDTSKMYSIANPCRYITGDTRPDNSSEKKKIVLVVSRFEESQKKLSRVIDAWKYIERDTDLSEWELKIVGYGPDEKFYLNRIQKKRLNRVKIIGQCDPNEYYKQAQIFLMTSVMEGFGLTLIEAQYFGCVPVVMNTFSALTDIIHNNQDGIIVDDVDPKVYSENLKALMIDSIKREKLAVNAKENSMRFSCQNISKLWYELFQNLANR